MEKWWDLPQAMTMAAREEIPVIRCRGPVYGQKKASGWFSLVPLLERGEQALVTHSGRAVYNPWLHPTFISLFLLSQFLQCFIQTSHLSLPLFLSAAYSCVLNFCFLISFLAHHTSFGLIYFCIVIRSFILFSCILIFIFLPSSFYFPHLFLHIHFPYRWLKDKFINKEIVPYLSV